MRLRNILFLFIMIVFVAAQLSAQSTNPVVSNVSHSYDFGTGKITITYKVSDPQGGTVSISMKVSSVASL